MAKIRFLITAIVCVLMLAGCRREPAEDSAPVERAESARAPQPQLQGPIPVPYEEPIVGGARMVAGKDILSNLRKSSEHRILVKAIEAAGLQEVFEGKGPITVFAPTDAAFERMQGGHEALLERENSQRLITLLSYHIVPERLDDDTLAKRVMAGNGSAQLTTAQGGKLKATVGDGAALIVDANGGTARITVPNVLHSNGVVQVIDKVLMP